MKKLFLLLVMVTVAWADDSQKSPDDQMVTVPRRYVSSEGLTKASSSAIS